MSLKLQVRTLDLLTKIVNGNINKIDFVPYLPQKGKCGRMKNRQPLARTTPEEQGVSSEYLRKFLEQIEKDDTIHTQGIMITRNKSVILECAYAPYDLDTWRITHSLCKSLTGIAVGIAMEEGCFGLDDTIATIMEKETHFIKVFRQKDITVRNLLTMSSGVSYNEIGAVISTSWTEDYLSSQGSFEPGSKFAYNSMNTYMLSAIIKKRTGQTLMEFLEYRLFQPLGIEQVYWESSLEENTKGGWGLYLTLEDRTKIGQLFLNKGKWGEKQIVSEQWLDEMTMKRMDTPEEMNQYGYGYHVWMGKRKGSFLFNGILGQFTIIYPDLNMVISIISSNADMFVKSRLMDIVDQFFSSYEFRPQTVLPPNKKSYGELKNYVAKQVYQKEFSYNKKPLSKKWGWCRNPFSKKNRFAMLFQDLPDEVQELSFDRYEAEENSASIIPLFIQTMQNNFSQGITKFQFELSGGQLVLNLEEHELQWRIPIGFQKGVVSTMNIHEELYEVSAWGCLKRTEEDVPVLKLQVSFLEMTNSRIMYFYFYKDSVRIKVKEIPDLKELVDKVIPFLGFALPSGGINTIKNMDLVQNKLSELTEPEFMALVSGTERKLLQ